MFDGSLVGLNGETIWVLMRPYIFLPHVQRFYAKIQTWLRDCSDIWMILDDACANYVLVDGSLFFFQIWEIANHLEDDFVNHEMERMSYTTLFKVKDNNSTATTWMAENYALQMFLTTSNGGGSQSCALENFAARSVREL